ncbi:MAG: hypothetical protein BGO97_11765 [Micrococcales bacterium 70-64]|nr:MAG: hypothetical protein ABT06_11765 [Leifsonia sp. SCN 70-46]OJX86334.1 MAG: hypothetical protein BGO97_11765 [Micrococcales bacterium 70-64]
MDLIDGDVASLHVGRMQTSQEPCGALDERSPAAPVVDLSIAVGTLSRVELTSQLARLASGQAAL